MFLNEDSDQRRIPVLLLSGFLGSGKTTVLNALLSDPRLADTAVAINEFGAIPIDQHMIDHGADSTLVLANGCLCCNLSGDMESAVMRLFSRRQAGAVAPFRRLIIEPSGLSDPAPIAQALLRNPAMARVFRLEAIVTMVDTLFARAQWEQHPENRQQIALADRLVLTKSDLAAPDQLAEVLQMLAQLNPVEPMVAAHGALDIDRLLPAGFLDPAAVAAPHAPVLRAHAVALALSGGPVAHDTDAVGICLTASVPLRWRALEAWLRTIRLTHADRLLRLKGLLNLVEARGPVVIQGVHHVIHAPVERRSWPDADERTRIVLITHRAVRHEIEASWAAALPGLAADPVLATTA